MATQSPAHGLAPFARAVRIAADVSASTGANAHGWPSVGGVTSESEGEQKRCQKGKNAAYRGGVLVHVMAEVSPEHVHACRCWGEECETLGWSGAEAPRRSGSAKRAFVAFKAKKRGSGQCAQHECVEHSVKREAGAVADTAQDCGLRRGEASAQACFTRCVLLRKH